MDYPPNQITYEQVCQYVGRLFLETNHELDKLRVTCGELQEKFVNAEQERIQLEAQLKVK